MFDGSAADLSQDSYSGQQVLVFFFNLSSLLEFAILILNVRFQLIGVFKRQLIGSYQLNDIVQVAGAMRCRVLAMRCMGCPQQGKPPRFQASGTRQVWAVGRPEIRPRSGVDADIHSPSGQHAVGDANVIVAGGAGESLPVQEPRRLLQKRRPLTLLLCLLASFPVRLHFRVPLASAGRYGTGWLASRFTSACHSV